MGCEEMFSFGGLHKEPAGSFRYEQKTIMKHLNKLFPV